MSVKKGPVHVLREKAKAKAMTSRMGNHRAVVTRTKSTFAEKAQAFEAHKRSIHGFRHGNFVNEGGVNPGTAWTYDGEGNRITTFHGDGLPDDSLGGIKAPKTAKERSDEDKRNSIASESKTHFTPRPFGWRKAMKACQAGRPVWAGSRDGSSGCYLAK